MITSEAYGIPGEAYGDPEADFGEYDEAWDDAYDEAARRGGKAKSMKPIAPGPAKSAYQPRPSTSNVTQAQLQAALARVSQQISTNSSAIKAIDTRVRSATAEAERAGIAARKEGADRKKEILAVRKDLQSTREMAAMLPLLTSLGGGGAMATFAPLLLLGNDVSGSDNANSNSALGGLGGTTGLIMLMALSGGLGSKTT